MRWGQRFVTFAGVEVVPSVEFERDRVPHSRVRHWSNYFDAQLADFQQPPPVCSLILNSFQFKKVFLHSFAIFKDSNPHFPKIFKNSIVLIHLWPSLKNVYPHWRNFSVESVSDSQYGRREKKRIFVSKVRRTAWARNLLWEAGKKRRRVIRMQANLTRAGKQLV